MSPVSSLQGQGIDPQAVFDNIDGTAVNAFNFNFLLAFSTGVGLSYPENAGVTLQAIRYYNSQHTTDVYVGCYFQEFKRLRRQNPMGLGWEFSFGRIIQVHNSDKRSWCSGPYTNPDNMPRDETNWAYIAPNGSRHVLEGYSTGPNSPNEYRSHDGSYLRALRFFYQEPDPPFDDITTWEVHFPDGTVQVLNHEVIRQTSDP